METKFCQFLHKITYISGYVRDIAEILERNRVFEVAQFNSNTNLQYCRPTLVAMVTKFCHFFYTKLAIFLVM